MQLFQSLWGWDGSLEAASERAANQGFDGLECNVAHSCLQPLSPDEVRQLCSTRGQPLILEITTGGGYTPDLADGPQQQLDQLVRGLDRARPMGPVKINLITGSDSWPEPEQHRFLEAVLDRSEAEPCPVMVETHRSRSLFNPWQMPLWLEHHPRLRLTADLSHWCCVAERLMTPDLIPVQVMADRVDHIHARIGHAQGPSVSHPFAPEWAEALEAHRRCWQLFVDALEATGRPITITPEFGPDGYMPLEPFSAEPVADVASINAAMAGWLRTALQMPGG
ncbi:MAG: sugar phosphate isomerase/epimerase [Cyanobacteriota bacterium]|nr:sugar phosphate isomerase/epimerase [Cyanobacteriota bacterium]